jgi:predicted amidohydrolase YtcJ
MHGAVLNSLGLKKYKITAETETPPGGVILRKPGSKEPSGLVMETAYLPIFAALPKPSLQESIAALAQAQNIYAAAGITTAHEGATHMADLVLLDGNPLTVEPMAIKDIKVLETIKEGKSVYRAN